MLTGDTNRICKIETARGLAFALSDKGDITNTMLQVVNKDGNCVDKFDSKFLASNYFTRFNHTYFHKSLSDCDNYIKLIQQDIEPMNVVDNMSFNLGVQLYSKINRIVYFHNIDMRIMLCTVQVTLR